MSPSTTQPPSSQPSGPPESDFPPKLGAPARRALENAGYVHLEQLTRVSQVELLKLHGMGPKGLRQLREAMAAKGLAFGDPPG